MVSMRSARVWSKKLDSFRSEETLPLAPRYSSDFTTAGTPELISKLDIINNKVPNKVLNVEGRLERKTCANSECLVCLRVGGVAGSMEASVVMTQRDAADVRGRARSESKFAFSAFCSLRA